jgi:intein/homing endonuclease
LDENKRTAFKPIRSVIRHKNTQNLFKIQTDCGWNISTTGSHSVFVLEDGDIAPKAVSDIKKDDVLLGSLDFSLKNKMKEIDILRLIEKRRPDVLDKIVICGFPESALKYFEGIEKRRIGWDSVSYNTYTASNKRHGKQIRYFNSMKEKELPIKLKITPELCRLLGYYVGEGCTYRSGVIFTFSLKEKQMIEDFENCVRKVFGNTNTRKRELHGSAMQIYIEGYLYKIFFDVLGAGKNAKEKRIPWIIYNVSDGLKKEFLRSYFKCDGNVKIRKSGYEICHNTVSSELASDLIWIHLNFGVVPKIETSITKPHLVKKTGQFIRTSSKKNRVVINGKENLSKVLWYLDGNVLTKFKGYISSKEKHSPSFLRIPIDKNIKLLTKTKVLDTNISYLLERAKYDKSISKNNVQEITDYFNSNNIEFDKRYNDLSHGSLGFFKVREIKKIKPNSEYVYDISVPGTEAFFAGMGPLLAHNTGGEPTLRPDLIEIIKLAKEEGFDHVQLNTNGIRISQDAGFAQKIRDAGVNTLYLSFDGLTPKTNIKNHWEVPGVLENCRKVGLRSVLVPTIIRGQNDHELGDIIKFGVKNIDTVSGVNFQPVSLVGMMPQKEREKHRMTIPDAIKKIEEQTKGQVGKEDFYPVPTVSPITNLIEAVTGKPKYDLSSHFACGMATYLFIDEKSGKYVPITRFVDVEGLLNHLNEKAEAIKSGKNKYVTSLRLLYDIRKFVDKEKQPTGLNISKMIYGVIAGKGKYSSLLKVHYKSLFIGMMHFMDKFNYDIERVKRCCIHYAMTDGRIIPFCAFNVIPEWYRDKGQKSQGISIGKWEKETGKKLTDDLYRRDIKKLRKDPLYRKTYRGFVKGVR